GEVGVAQPVVTPGGVEVAVVRRCHVIVAHVVGTQLGVLAESRWEGNVGDAEAGTHTDRVAGDRADPAVTVNEAVVGRMVAAVVPEDAVVAAIGGHRQGWHPLVGRGVIVIDPDGPWPRHSRCLCIWVCIQTAPSNTWRHTSTSSAASAWLIANP